jgi:hypothetical protein
MNDFWIFTSLVYYFLWFKLIGTAGVPLSLFQPLYIYCLKTSLIASIMLNKRDGS